MDPSVVQCGVAIRMNTPVNSGQTLYCTVQNPFQAGFSSRFLSATGNVLMESCLTECNTAWHVQVAK